MSMDPDFRQDDGEGDDWTIQQVSVLQIKISSHVTLNMPFSLLDKFKPDRSGSSPAMTNKIGVRKFTMNEKVRVPGRNRAYM